MKKLTFNELARKVLREEKRPMTSEEIWRVAQERGYSDSVGTKGKTPWVTIGARIYVNMKNNENSPFVKIDSKPKKFFLKELASEGELNKIKQREKDSVEEPKKTSYSERELHPLLTYYAISYMDVYTKTIKHERSGKKAYAQWLHPDLVGAFFPEEWTPEVLDFGISVGSKLIRLYSFEMKKELTFSNIRESFFQTVSNSSWANESYLAAAKISSDEEFRSELKRLSTSFGIGIIKLDIEDPDSSEVLFPARTKTELDWETINKLARENRDFKEFVTRIKNDLASKEVRKEKYDTVLTTEELTKRLKK